MFVMNHLAPAHLYFYWHPLVFFSKNREDICTQGSPPDIDSKFIAASLTPIASFPPVSTTPVVTSFISFILIADIPAVNLLLVSTALAVICRWCQLNQW
jgi:hypothetical protein